MRVKLYRDKYYYAVWSENGRTKRVSLRTQNREEAERELIDLEKRHRPERKTVAEIMDAYIAEKNQTAIRPERIASAWKSLKPVFGHLRPDQIDRETCRKYTIARRKMRWGKRKSFTQDGTILKELSVLRAAVLWQDKRSPAVFEMPHAPAPRERHLSRDEYERLKKAAEKTPHLYTFIVLALTTAGRAEAILELTWDRANPEGSVIDLRKGSGRRKGRARVPINSQSREALQRAYKASMTDYVIEYAGGPVKSVKKAFARACDDAKLTDVTPHVLRHTAAVWLAEAGVPMSEIAQYLGHTDSRVTERVYGRYSPEYLSKASKALE